MCTCLHAMCDVCFSSRSGRVLGCHNIASHCPQPLSESLGFLRLHHRSTLCPRCCPRFVCRRIFGLHHRSTLCPRKGTLAVRESASQRSVDVHQWFKSKPAAADTDAAVRQLWYRQKPTIYKSRTGPGAKNAPSRAFGAWVCASIGKAIGAFITPKNSAVTAANNSKDYECRQCGKSCKMANIKRNMIRHLSHADNTKCIELYSESGDEREKLWVTAASNSTDSTDYECRQCGNSCKDTNIKRGMVLHLSHADNTKCLELYSKSSDQREMDWVTAASDSKDYECRQCGKSCRMTNIKRDMVRHLSHADNTKCLELYSKSSDQLEMDWVRLLICSLSRVDILQDTIHPLLIPFSPTSEDVFADE